MEDSMKIIDDATKQATDLLTTYGMSVIGAIVILIVGLWAAKWLSRMLERALKRTDKVDVTLRAFFASLVKYVVVAFTVLAVLSEFGVQTASLIAVFGAAGLAVGLAIDDIPEEGVALVFGGAEPAVGDLPVGIRVGIVRIAVLAAVAVRRLQAGQTGVDVHRLHLTERAVLEPFEEFAGQSRRNGDRERDHCKKDESRAGSSCPG